MIGYVVAQNAAPSMIVYPTEDLARSVSENRLQPMLRISPQLEKHFKDNDSELLELQFDNMYLSLTVQIHRQAYPPNLLNFCF